MKTNDLNNLVKKESSDELNEFGLPHGIEEICTKKISEIIEIEDGCEITATDILTKIICM